MEEDDFKIEYLHYIKNIMSDELKIITTAWSAPAWMKDSKSITWGKEILDETISCITRKKFTLESFKVFII